MSKPAFKMACRQIAQTDIGVVVALLREGFPYRPVEYWPEALRTLRERVAPDGYPRYGYLIERDGSPVGLILLIFAAIEDGLGVQIRCNVSSWYVKPEFRNYAVLLTSAALSFKQASYLNISPAPNTWPILEAQGYRRYSNGQMACLPALTLGGAFARVRRYEPDEADPALERLLEPAARGRCLVLICETGAESVPFVFVRREIKRFGRAVQLAYCPDTSEFVRFAGALGRYLLRRGYPLVLVDSEGPVTGLIGKFFNNRMPKYFRGGFKPRLNDLRHTEALLFGV